MTHFGAAQRRFHRVALGVAIAIAAAGGTAQAFSENGSDADTIKLQAKVPLTASLSTCGAGFTNSSFSFDISEVDQFLRAMFLADRTAGGIDVVDLTAFPPTLSKVLTPPGTDPFAGIRCDANGNFGGSAAAGRNEVTGPNAPIIVNHAEVWVTDAPSFSSPLGQTNSAADYAGDNCDSNVRVFNINTGKQTDHINVGGCFRTDEGDFDPVDQVVLVANPSEQPLSGNYNQGGATAPFLTLISSKPVAPGESHQILTQIPFDGTNGTPNATNGIEQARWSSQTGLFYVAVPSDGFVTTGSPPVQSPDPNGAVAIIDARHPDNIKVRGKFALTNCSPNGLALGPDYEAYLGCSGGPTQVINIRNGHLIATITTPASAGGTGGGCDEVAFNAGDDHFLGACTNKVAPGGSDYLDITDADLRKVGPQLDKEIITAGGAHSVAADPVEVLDFVPAFGGPCGSLKACIAVFGPNPPSSGGGDDPSVFVQE